MSTPLTMRINHDPDGSWWATCDEIPGWILGYGSLEELRREIQFGLREMLFIGDAEITEVFEEAVIEA